VGAAGLRFAIADRDSTMRHPISRRTFLRRAALIAAAVPPAHLHALSGHAAAELRIGVLSPSGASDTGTLGTLDARLGVRLGVDEATHAAALFGGSIEVVPVTLTSLRASRLSALLGAGDRDGCRSLSDAAAAAGIAFLNVRCADDGLRGSECRATTFHVAPSDAMYRDALAQAGAQAGARATAWDASLTRFGADTLNARFRARFNRAMTADAWLGWVAVKILWESSLRAKSTDSRMLMQYMTRPGTQFDGHKGRALSFRPWDQQLRQPVYVVSAAGSAPPRVIAEAPVPASAGETTSESLDRLGTPAARSACRMSP